ncbi:CYB protein, partial [Steatornis caripensis]|nr:CYB protein [Steatornis caripensis]
TLIHLTFLHESASKNPLGIVSNCNKILFHAYFSLKDTLGFILMFLPLTTLALF